MDYKVGEYVDIYIRGQYACGVVEQVNGHSVVVDGIAYDMSLIEEEPQKSRKHNDYRRKIVK